MKYQIGDRVLILHSNEEAEVVDIINDQMLLVDIKGIQFPVYTDQVDFPYFKRFTEKKDSPAQKKKIYIDDIRKEKHIPLQKEKGVWLNYLPVMKTDEAGHDIVEWLKIHLINQTSLPYHFHYSIKYTGKTDLAIQNIIHPGEDFYLHDILFEKLNDNPSFECQFSLVQKDNSKTDSVNKMIRLRPKTIFKEIRELREKGLAVFSRNLFSVYPDKTVSQTVEIGTRAKNKNLFDAGEPRESTGLPEEVVDLHIEKLVADHSRMNNFEILTLQLKIFGRAVEQALAHHLSSLIVIHGIGEGRLRDEIHLILKKMPSVERFVNEYNPRYGFGATEIFFRY